METSYEFDPCTLDNENQVGIYQWTPRPKEERVPKSEWRKQQNNGDYNQQPGIDELRKIKFYLKRKFPDNQIMDSFGISAETLVAIKKDKYSPIDGIALDNQSKIYKEFTNIERRIDFIFDALKFIADNAFPSEDNVKRLAFKKLITAPFKKKKSSSYDEEE